MIFYLHGFASSSKSTKAGFFGERLRQCGLSVRCPDFNEPEFSTLTMTRMLDQLAREVEQVDEATVTLMGSSLGGTLAVLAAERLGARIDNLVLMAPAVMFAKAGHHLLPPERIAEWRTRGALPFFHYGYNEERMLRVDFYNDSLTHDAFNAQFTQPTLIFQGRHDASVPAETVSAFAKTRRNVALTMLDDDHQLIKSLPRMWQDVEAFLGLVD
ncbi:MAG: YqiA/YcfP family alpha/beta fold hydrolase [Vicinamibacterales bacterium]